MIAEFLRVIWRMITIILESYHAWSKSLTGTLEILSMCRKPIITQLYVLPNVFASHPKACLDIKESQRNHNMYCKRSKSSLIYSPVTFRAKMLKFVNKMRPLFHQLRFFIFNIAFVFCLIYMQNSLMLCLTFCVEIWQLYENIIIEKVTKK